MVLLPSEKKGKESNAYYEQANSEYQSDMVSSKVNPSPKELILSIQGVQSKY